MERGRKTKVIVILALVVAVVGMSLGFAAFSNVLTISSSATVTPSEDDFKMVMYGIGEDVVYDVEVSVRDNLPIDPTLYNSLTTSKPFIVNSNSDNLTFSATSALIDNENDKITNVMVNLTEPGQRVYYVFLIKNEGLYDAYINAPDYVKVFYEIPHTCTMEEDTTESLAQEVCKNIAAYASFLYPDNNNIIFGSLTDSYKIAPGDYIRFSLQIKYNGSVRADGPISVNFEDLKGIFTTVPTGTIINE